jgi:hypothetical protein
MFSDGSYLFEAGWLFFAAWSVTVLTFFVITFGKDLLGGQGSPDSRPNKAAPQWRPTNSRSR